MSETQTEYLAVNVLNEGHTVTYRSLSRALKVHSNLAKQMLHQFYQTQSKKTPGSLHATYLLTGRQVVRRQSADTDTSQRSMDVDDMVPPSSSFPASSAAEVPENKSQDEESWMKLVTLAKEEDLADAKATFDELSSIHIYSLEPGTIKDLEVLADCNRKLAVDYVAEDPLTAWKIYGTIQNTNVKRRTGRRLPPPAAAPPPTAEAKPKTALSVKQEPYKATPKFTPPVKNTTNTSAAAQPASQDTASDSDAKSTSSSRKTTTTKPPPIKREVSSLFKSFAKSKPPAPKAATDESVQAPSAPTPAEDESMGGLSDEDADEGDVDMLDEGAIDSTTGKSKTEREEMLRLMMEAEDDPMDDSLPEPPASAPTPSQEASQPQSQSQSEPELAETVTVSDGRRRGRRRVMKKKTVRDEEGYLVTKEELAWESFSEDEPAPKKPKISAPVSAAAKAKKGGAGKPGQGNIMSFFKKA